MAYINLAGGLKINTADAVDSRLVLTKAEMKSLHYANDESRPATLRGKIFQLPSNYLCVCSEDNKIYVYNASNEEDELTGKFRKVESDGGTPMLYLGPYYDNNTQILSQEGRDLLLQKLMNNEVVGISLGAEAICMFFDAMTETDLVFVGPDQGGLGRLKMSINIESGAVVSEVEKTASLTKVWYELPNLLLLENITQKQFDEIKNLALQNQLAGINCGGLYCFLEFYQEGENLGFFYPWYENGIFTAYLIRLDTDLSVKKIPYSTITLPSTSPTSQVIPSITTSNAQQNLTVGDGLAIENGALKTTSSGQSIADLPVIELTSETTTITDETVKAKILENVNNDNYLICKLKIGTIPIEILITRDTKLVPDDTFTNTVFTQSVFLNLGIAASTVTFTLSINSKDGTITIEYETVGYIKDNKVSLVLKPNESFGVTTDYGDTNLINGLELYFDTINGKPIIHSDNAINSYDIPTITFED